MPTTPPKRAVKTRVLVVDDDLATQSLLSEVLVADGYEVYLAPRVREVREFYLWLRPDVVLLDWRLPDGDGMDLLPEMKHQWPEATVIMMTGYGTPAVALEAARRGAFQFMAKPFHVDELLAVVKEARDRKAQQASPGAPGAVGSNASSAGPPPLFQSPALKNVLRLIEHVAPTEAPVLITGERGTGKKVIASFIHARSPRARGPLVKVRCADLPRELAERELFGGGTGEPGPEAAEHAGRFHEAEGGTLLLDEICDLPVEVQLKLLEALETGEFQRIGGSQFEKMNFRLIVTTGWRVMDAIHEKRLSENLYYRINTVTLSLPPLRERRQVILPLASSFLQHFAAQAGRTLDGFTPEAEAALQSRDWPGNVRQLGDEVRQAVSVCAGNRVDVKDFSPAIQSAPA